MGASDSKHASPTPTRTSLNSVLTPPKRKTNVMSQDAAFSPCKQLLDVKGSSSTHKTIAVVNRGDCVAVWDPLTEEKKSTSKAVAKEDFLYVQLAHQGKNTVVVSPGVKDTVIRLYDNERLSDSEKGISQNTLKDVSLTYVTPEKLFGHRGSMAIDGSQNSKVFQYLGASGSKLVSFTMDGRMNEDTSIVRKWWGEPTLNKSKEFKSYRGIQQIVPFARRLGFVARCGDGYIRRYEQTVESLSAAAQPKANAKFYLEKNVPPGRDSFVTFVSVKADGKWMLVTTRTAIYLTNWVDDDKAAEDIQVVELGLDPTVKVPDFGDYEYNAAKFDSSIEDDVTNSDMCEKRIGAFITPGEGAAYTDTVMVEWNLRDIFRGDDLKISTDDDNLPVLKKGSFKLYKEHGSSPAPITSTPSANVDEWAWNKGSHAIATLGDEMKTMKIQM